MDKAQLAAIMGRCIAACGNCASGCLEEEHVDKMRDCIKTDLDCADYCSMVLKLISRNSPLGHDLLQKCVEICERCESECRKHQDVHCKKCADACRQCIDACNSYLQSTT